MFSRGTDYKCYLYVKLVTTLALLFAFLIQPLKRQLHSTKRHAQLFFENIMLVLKNGLSYRKTMA